MIFAADGYVLDTTHKAVHVVVDTFSDHADTCERFHLYLLATLSPRSPSRAGGGREVVQVWT